MVDFMKISGPHVIGGLLLLMVSTVSTMCIYTYPPRDVYKNSIWTSTDRPLGPFDVEELTLRFEDGGTVVIVIDDKLVLRGEYQDDGSVVTLNGMQTVFDGVSVTFIEVHMNGGDDTVFLLWQVQRIFNPFTTALHRIDY